MANISGTGIKNATVDVAKRLQRAGEAIVVPTRLGNEGITAFRTLKTLEGLAALLPMSLQPLAKALLGLGIENVGRHGDPRAKDVVRDYASSLAVKAGRVAPEVLDRAVNKEQKAALYKASKEGDLATVKSILRHNKKHGAQLPSVEELAARIGSAKNIRAATGQVDIDLGNARLKIEVAGKRNGGGFEVTGSYGGRALHGQELLDMMKLARDAGIKAGGVLGSALATRVSEMKKLAGMPIDGVDAGLAAQEAARLDGSGSRAQAELRGADGTRYLWGIAGKPNEATRIGSDGKETTLKGTQLQEIVDELAKKIAALKDPKGADQDAARFLQEARDEMMMTVVRNTRR